MTTIFQGRTFKVVYDPKADVCRVKGGPASGQEFDCLEEAAEAGEYWELPEYERRRLEIQ